MILKHALPIFSAFLVVRPSQIQVKISKSNDVIGWLADDTLKAPNVQEGVKTTEYSEKWAVLVAGSKGWRNYDDEANVCHAYHLLTARGIKKENIVTMMYNDIANNPRNPDKGVIINEPNGTNVYGGVYIDYKSTDVSAKTFLMVLKNDSIKVGSGRTIESFPEDTIFVYFTGQGFPGGLAFPETILYAKEFNVFLKDMSEMNKFAKMLLYIDAPYSGSLFEELLPRDYNIMAVTAAAPWQTTYKCYKDTRLGVSLGSYFSVNWMHDTESRENLQESLVRDQISLVSGQTTTSTISKYGDLRIEEVPLSVFMGTTKKTPKKFTPCQSSAQRNFQRQIRWTKGTEDITDLAEMPDIQENNRKGESIINNILLLVVQQDRRLMQQFLSNAYKLNMKNVECYEGLVRHFDKKCLKIAENLQLGKHLHIFINMCSSDKTNPKQIRRAMDQVCVRTD